MPPQSLLAKGRDESRVISKLNVSHERRQGRRSKRIELQPDGGFRRCGFEKQARLTPTGELCINFRKNFAVEQRAMLGVPVTVQRIR